jgi:hypothetical protein
VASTWPDVWQRYPGRVLSALDARSGGRVHLGAFEIMAARRDELRRLARIPRAFEVRPARPDDRALVASFLRDAGRTGQLFSSGDAGFLGLAEGAVQAMEWVRFGPADYDWDAKRLGLVFGLPPRSCWLHNGMGGEGGAQGPWAMVMGRLPAFLEEHGIEFAYLQVARENAYSIRCHESLGFRRVGRVVHMRAGRLRFVRLRASGEKWLRWHESRLDLERLTI